MHNTQQRQRIVFSLPKNQPTKEQNLEPKKSSLHAEEVAILSRQNPQKGLQSPIIVEPARSRVSGAPLLRKFGNLSSQKILVAT